MTRQRARVAPAPSPPRIGPLRGLGVLVTRPAHQAVSLAQRIEAEGGRAIRFPVLEIVGIEDPVLLQPIRERIQDFELAIFVSTNAVHYSLHQLQLRQTLKPGLKIAAVGQSTAKALEQAGLQPTIEPVPPFTSESLLATPALQKGAIAGKRTVIFRGAGGREYLGKVLAERGAQVDYAEVYRRRRPLVTPSKLHDLQHDIDIIVITSGDALRNLFEMVDPKGRNWLCTTPFVAVSERVGELAKQFGVTQQVITADFAGDEGILEALRRWCYEARPT